MPADDDAEFVDAESEPDDELRVYTHQETEQDSSPSHPQKTRRPSSKSFVTASSTQEPEPENSAERTQDQEQASNLQVPTREDVAFDKALGKRPLSTVESTNGAPPSTVGGRSASAVSTTSLLPKADHDKGPLDAELKSPSKGILARVKRRSEPGSSSDAGSPLERAGESMSRTKSNLRNLVKFDIPEDSKRASVHLRTKQAQMSVQRASGRLRRRKIKDGLVVKMERMLVRVDATAKDVPDEFDENGSQMIDSRVKDKWREYMIVCRHSTSEDADFVLQMYKTRVSACSNFYTSGVLTPLLGYPRDRRA